MIKNERPIEYQMTKRMFNTILEKRSEIEKKENPYSYVMKVINEEFGLRGKVTSIFIISQEI